MHYQKPDHRGVKGVNYADGIAEETVEDLLNYKRRSQASCICTSKFRVTESKDFIYLYIDLLGISKEISKGEMT